MNTRARNRNRLLPILFTALLVILPEAQAGKLYKWVDENGQVRYGDQIPARYARNRNETLNDHGVVLETRAAAKTPEQIAEEQRLERLRKEEERKRREQAHKDRILLDTFTNEDEMIMTRDGKIEAIEAIIRVTKGRIGKIKQRLSSQRRRAASLERSGKPVPETLKQQIAESRQQIRHNIQYIKNRRIEQQAIRDKFEADIKRFRELKLAEARKKAD
ncbi:MAG TPA: DUF4124 domain-containing protein [Gammaproteobacteria bacterium]|nr:DUF4124 domain-containing protein [Gammaproteobacteria bacterium]